MKNVRKSHHCEADHEASCDILTTRDGWDADCTCTQPALAALYREAVEALRAIREASHYACSEKHGLDFIEAPSHELKCVHARNVIRAEAVLAKVREVLGCGCPVPDCQHHRGLK
jgi:hypothetical protein